MQQIMYTRQKNASIKWKQARTETKLLCDWHVPDDARFLNIDQPTINKNEGFSPLFISIHVNN